MSTPEDPEWLAALIERSPALPDPVLREHWRKVVSWFPAPLRYELAGILMDVEVACQH